MKARSMDQSSVKSGSCSYGVSWLNVPHILHHFSPIVFHVSTNQSICYQESWNKKKKTPAADRKQRFLKTDQSSICSTCSDLPPPAVGGLLGGQAASAVCLHRWWSAVCVSQAWHHSVFPTEQKQTTLLWCLYFTWGKGQAFSPPHRLTRSLCWLMPQCLSWV